MLGERTPRPEHVGHAMSPHPRQRIHLQAHKVWRCATICGNTSKIVCASQGAQSISVCACSHNATGNKLHVAARLACRSQSSVSHRLVRVHSVRLAPPNSCCSFCAVWRAAFRRGLLPSCRPAPPQPGHGIVPAPLQVAHVAGPRPFKLLAARASSASTRPANAPLLLLPLLPLPDETCSARARMRVGARCRPGYRATVD